MFLDCWLDCFLAKNDKMYFAPKLFTSSWANVREWNGKVFSSKLPPIGDGRISVIPYGQTRQPLFMITADAPMDNIKFMIVGTPIDARTRTTTDPWELAILMSMSKDESWKLVLQGLLNAFPDETVNRCQRAIRVASETPSNLSMLS